MQYKFAFLFFLVAYFLDNKIKIGNDFLCRINVTKNWPPLIQHHDAQYGPI